MHGIGRYQPINPDGPTSHLQNKQETPTAGGVFLILGITIAVVLFGRLRNPYTYIPLIALWAFGTVGGIDDVTKLARRESVGLRTSRKLSLQILAAAFILWMVNRNSGLVSAVITHPWNPAIVWDIGMWYPIAFLFYLVLFVNSVNITDGLDALATGVAFSPILFLAILAALFGTGLHLTHIQLPIHEGGLDLLVVLAATVGALLAFIWYNGPKALIFMGDTGSHAIGALIAVSALLMKVELTVLVASGVFIIECVSSVVQIIAIRLFGKKVFLMAPLHHHFEKKGVSEGRIVVRFQIASVVCTVVAGVLFMVKYR